MNVNERLNIRKINFCLFVCFIFENFFEKVYVCSFFFKYFFWYLFVLFQKNKIKLEINLINVDIY